MKATIMFCVIGFFLLNFSSPLQQETPEQIAKRETIEMKKSLDLKEDQVIKIKDINLKYAKKRQKLISHYKDNQSLQRKISSAMQHKKEYEFKETLTNRQFKAYQTLEIEKSQTKTY